MVSVTKVVITKLMCYGVTIMSYSFAWLMDGLIQLGEGTICQVDSSWQITVSTARSLILIEPLELMTRESVFQVLLNLRSRLNS
jgi:hypothetical protein